MDKPLEGMLWLREVFLQAQYKGPQAGMMIPMFVAMALGAMQIMMVILTQREKQDLEGQTMAQWSEETTFEFWLFNSPLIMIQIMLGTVNAIFMFAVLQDLSRRDFAAQRLTEMLEVDLNRKSTIGIKLCSLNFVDPASLLTWMEIRKMIFDVGKRFYIRLEGDIFAFSACFIIELVIVLAKLNGIVDFAPFFSNYHYILFGFHFASIAMYNGKTLLVAANINEESGNSIEKLVNLRHLNQRMLMDKRILAEDFVSVSADMRKATRYIHIRALKNVEEKT